MSDVPPSRETVEALQAVMVNLRRGIIVTENAAQRIQRLFDAIGADLARAEEPALEPPSESVGEPPADPGECPYYEGARCVLLPLHPPYPLGDGERPYCMFSGSQRTGQRAACWLRALAAERDALRNACALYQGQRDESTEERYRLAERLGTAESKLAGCFRLPPGLTSSADSALIHLIIDQAADRHYILCPHKSTVRVATSSDIPDALVSPTQAARVLGLREEDLLHLAIFAPRLDAIKAVEAARRVRESQPAQVVGEDEVEVKL